MAPQLSPFMRTSAVTKPRQLAPTVGISHDGFEFLKGSFDGIKGYVVGWMTTSRRGKLYIDNAGWGPEVDSIKYGTGSPMVGFTSSSARLANRPRDSVNRRVSTCIYKETTRRRFRANRQQLESQAKRIRSLAFETLAIPITTRSRLLPSSKGPN